MPHLAESRYIGVDTPAPNHSWTGNTSVLLSLVLGTYAADLHKLLLTVSAFFTGDPSSTSDYGRSADIVFGALTGCIAFGAVLTKRCSLRSLMSLPAACTVLLAILMTISLEESSDPVSLENYYRFMGGNVLLFFASLVCCQTLRVVNLIWRVWLLTSTVLAAISIYLFLIGITWSAGRASLFPGTGIRAGYFCGLSVIYLAAVLVLTAKPSRMLVRTGMIGSFAAGVLLSGSKASLLLMIACLIMLFFVNFLISREMKPVRIASLFFILVVVASVIVQSLAGLEEVGAETGYLSELNKTDAYTSAAVTRVDLDRAYIEIGMQSPLLGRGISAAYMLSERTHSMTVALFVQVGLLGVTAYFLFLIGLILPAFNKMALVATSSHRSVILCTVVVVIFLAMKAEVTGDVAANRELWMFGGMLSALTRSA